ncbi:MAG: peptidoglycan-binding protein [Clostridia bacterium]|nr:peptidoglycan-binding protein [Clostridia bacterium]
MYKVYDKKEAIRLVQIYIAEISKDDAYVAPTGVYDENTLNSVLNFQRASGLETTGVVDKETFDALFSEYSLITERDMINNSLSSFINFPILPGDSYPAISNINIIMSILLDHYGYTHSIRKNNYYSPETAEAVRILRGIYRLNDIMLIDEIFYKKLMGDYNSLPNK